MTGDRKFPPLTAAKKQCGTKSSKDQKIYRSRGQLQPRFPAYAAEFLRYCSSRRDRTVALEHVQKKLLGFVNSDMPQLFDFGRVLIDQMVLVGRGALVSFAWIWGKISL